ncbi:hypothetical protein [Microbacterium dauci]|uniref:Ig-like domain-containing protein n=1 Tax=Microbacterium dauci TaxID=3048008 RepID=A0ABT6ZBP6_9MICO|nr:hypothetical protein [Microbacterium sp. LX3-4]MDJ1113576.1 hypothetical protein [Microbacterium sp. LX3-4]
MHGIAVFLALGATGCTSTEVTCPAIAYFATLEVRVAGAAASVDDVVLCLDDVCATEGAASEVGIVTTPPVRSDDTWTFTGEFPEGMTVRAVDAAGEVLVDQVVDVTWTRIGGTEACGGPTFGSLTLEI